VLLIVEFVTDSTAQVPQEKQQVAVAKPAADQHIVVHRQERETTQENRNGKRYRCRCNFSRIL